MKKNQILLILLGLIILIILESNFFLVRALSPKQIDDVHPLAGCQEEWLKDSDILWVIPKYKGIPITSNTTWCEDIKKLNKEIGMHGLTHEFKEFGGNVSEADFKEGIKLIEECLGKKPTMFKPPHLTVSKKNKELIDKYNLKLKNQINQFTSKVYHCNNTGLFSNELMQAF